MLGSSPDVALFCTMRTAVWHIIISWCPSKLWALSAFAIFTVKKNFTSRLIVCKCKIGGNWKLFCETWVSLRRSQVSINWTVQPLHWAALLSNAKKKKRVHFQTFITFFNLIFSLAWNLLQLTSYLYSFIANLTAPWSSFSPESCSYTLCDASIDYRGW